MTITLYSKTITHFSAVSSTPTLKEREQILEKLGASISADSNPFAEKPKKTLVMDQKIIDILHDGIAHPVFHNDKLIATATKSISSEIIYESDVLDFIFSNRLSLGNKD